VGKGDRRKITIDFLNPTLTVVVHSYQFSDCAITHWEGRALSTSSTLGSEEIIAVDCAFDRITSASNGRPALAAWINQLVVEGDGGETGPNPKAARDIKMLYLNPQIPTNVLRTFSYQSAFPVKFTFSDLDAAANSVLSESIEIQANGLTVQ
jgi:hypothetical protein